MARLHLVCGPPGAGKTTRARDISRHTGAARMSPDDWMNGLGIPVRDAQARELIETAQWSLTLLLLAQGRDVVIEWGTWTRLERVALIAAATEAGHVVSAHVLTPPLETLQWRIAQRNSEQASGDGLTPEEVAEAADWFEPPDSDELERYESVWRDGAWP